MNYKKEEFPVDINKLIQKCEDTISILEDHFANKDCLIVNDLYIESTSNRCNDFLEKLQVTCNNKLHEKVKNENELQGLYVFGEFNKENGKIIPVYIGISRTIIRRLRQHVWGKNHNEATFAYLKARNNKKYNDDSKHEFIKLEQEEIKKYHFMVIPEKNYYDMYFMEVYIAGKLKIYWNSFKTH